MACGKTDRGVAICGSGVGACVVANKVSGIPACLIHQTFSAHQGVEDDAVALSVGNNNSNTTYSGVLSGTGSLTKIGTGVLTLSGANTYSGATTISGGTLKLGASNVIPNGANTGNVTDNGTLDMGGFSDTINGLGGGGIVDNSGGGTPTLTVGNNNASGTFSGVVQNTTGTLGLTKIGTGDLTLSGNNTFSGVLTVQAGTLTVATVNNAGPPVRWARAPMPWCWADPARSARWSTPVPRHPAPNPSPLARPAITTHSGV